MKRTLILCSTALLLFSCSRDLDLPQSEANSHLPLLSSDSIVLVQEYEIGQTLHKLKYNSSHQLSVIEHWTKTNTDTNYRQTERIEYKFGSGRQSGFYTYSVNPADSSKTLLHETNFVYDGVGNIIKTYKAGSTDTLRYTYNTEGRVIDTAANGISYTAQGNMFSPDFVQNYPGGYWGITSAYNYSTRLSPFRDNRIGQLLYLTFSEYVGYYEILLSDHLPDNVVRDMVSGTSSSSVVYLFRFGNTFSFSYDSAGLPQKLSGIYHEEQWEDSTHLSSAENPFQSNIVCIRKPL